MISRGQLGGAHHSFGRPSKWVLLTLMFALQLITAKQPGENH